MDKLVRYIVEVKLKEAGTPLRFVASKLGYNLWTMKPETRSTEELLASASDKGLSVSYCGNFTYGVPKFDWLAIDKAGLQEAKKVDPKADSWTVYTDIVARIVQYPKEEQDGQVVTPQG